MTALVDAHDWAATPLGSRESWSPSLRQAVATVLASGFPMALRWGPEFVLIYNDGYRPILGDKHPGGLGRPAREVWSEVWEVIRPAHEAIFRRETNSIFAEDLPLRVQRRDAAWEDARFTLSYSPIEDATEDLGIGGIMVTAIETTARVSAEAALRASEAALQESRSYLNDLLRSSGEAFYAVDREGVTTLCNDAFLRTLGFDAEDQVIGRKLHDVIHHTHPDGTAYDKVDCPIYQCAGTGVAAHVEHESFYRANGKPFPVEYWVNPIYREGVQLGAICTFIDITERRAAEQSLAQSEAQFRAFAQAVPNHVWSATPDGALNWFNERVYAYSGAVEADLLGAGWPASQRLGQTRGRFGHPQEPDRERCVPGTALPDARRLDVDDRL